MVIEIKPEQQSILDAAVQSGAYQTAQEALDHAFDVIRAEMETDDWLVRDREAIAAHITIGYEQSQRGELMDGETAIAMLRSKRADRLNRQG